MRRNTKKIKHFRGIIQNKVYNDLGWPDKVRDYTAKPDQIVFIGDSFLEVRSSKNLAQLTEQQLRNQSYDTEIINLAQGNTGIDHYRHRFYEFALELKPKCIFIFIYNLNDLVEDYRYSPYKHVQFTITKKALSLLQDMDFPEETKQTLNRYYGLQKVFKNKTDMLNNLQELNLTSVQKNLIYLVTHGYASCNSQRDNSFVFASVTLIKKLLVSVRQLKTNHRPTWGELYPEYKKIFTLPKPDRLEAIANFVCHKYLLMKDDQVCLSFLKKQDSRFLDYLTQEVDMPYYFFPAFEQGLQKTLINSNNTANRDDLAHTANEYAKVFDEMQRIVKGQDINLVIVLIPEASYVDKEFQKFWAPMIDFRQFFLKNYMLSILLKEKLLEKNLSVVDLGDFSDRFHDSYWKFDGHWNEKGNQEVSNIIATYILLHQIMDE